MLKLSENKTALTNLGTTIKALEAQREKFVEYLAIYGIDANS